MGPQKSYCPLKLQPSDDLSALYARCLGPDWENVARDYNSWNAFKAPQATLSLVSSFLYDNILAQQAYDPEVIRGVIKLLRMRGITGRAAQAICDLSNRGKSFGSGHFPPDLTPCQRKTFSKPLATSPLKKPRKILSLSSFNMRKRKAT